MYIVYYDSGTTNTRAYLLKNGQVAAHLAKAIGARNSALERDSTRLVGELYGMYEALLHGASLTDADVSRIYLSGMISSPSGMVEVEHLTAPVDAAYLSEHLEIYEEPRFFKRALHIVPGIKTLARGCTVEPPMAADVNIMRGEEIEVFGILRANPQLKAGACVFLLPGSHTQAVMVRDGRIERISSNITGEFFRAITRESILGASVAGGEQWEMDPEMIRMGGDYVHTYGFNRAMYILRVLDLFTETALNGRRSYFEGALNVGVMDAVTEMLRAAGEPLEPRSIPLAVVGDEIQKQIFEAFCESRYPQYRIIQVNEANGMPYSVSGLLEICGGEDLC